MIAVGFQNVLNSNIVSSIITLMYLHNERRHLIEMAFMAINNTTFMLQFVKQRKVWC
jgi:hypothetical protein